MSRTIGYDRTIRIDWLDITAEKQIDIGDTEKIRHYLHDYLQPHHESYEARKKTITVLTRIWSRVPQSDITLRDRGLDLFQKVDSNERIWLHWGMCLLAYPFFQDMIRAIHRCLFFYDKCTRNEIEKKMFHDWGYRTTLKRATGRVLDSLVEWKIIQRNQKNKSYLRTQPITTERIDIQLWMLEIIIKINKRHQIPYSSLHSMAELFPFQFSLNLSDISNATRFSLSSNGGKEMWISLE